MRPGCTSEFDHLAARPRRRTGSRVSGYASGPAVFLLGYGVGVPAAAVCTAILTTQALASASPSLRTSPTMAGGKRAESPSPSVNAVLAATVSGSAGTGIPG